MSRYQDIHRHRNGFSLIEIMIGITISMFSVLVIIQVYALFQGQKRTATSGSDAQTDGGIAVYSIERDVRMAGYGFNMPGALGCAVKRYYNGANLGDLSLNPVTITQGANGLPDTITIFASSKGNGSIPARVSGTDLNPSTDNFYLNSTLGLADNDFMVAYEPGKTCTLMQVTGTSNNVQVWHESSVSKWNPPGNSQSIFPTSRYSTSAMVFNLGSIVQNTYSVDANYNLLLTSYASATNGTNPQTVIPNVVNLQAQYGFDNRPGAQADSQVSRWSDTMIDADGSGGTAGDSGDIGRIYAIRLAIVTRSAAKEAATNSNGSCNYYSRTNPLFKKPAWTADDGTGSLISTLIDVTKNPDGTANANWECYRYKVFETIIPLRNLLWRDT